MGSRSGIPLVLVLAATLLVSASPARAQLTHDTLYVGSSQLPAICVDPGGAPHIAFPTAGGIQHAWRVAGVWQSEIITPEPTGGTFLNLKSGPTGRLALLRRNTVGQLVVHRSGGSGWEPDTIPAPVTFSSTTPLSLSLDPATDIPVVSFAGNLNGLNRLWIARRESAGWLITQIDSSAGGISPPAVSLSHTGNLRLAVLRDQGPAGEGEGMYFAEAASELAPFAWTRVDTNASASSGAPSLALDPVTGDPRVAYIDGYNYLGYASRSDGAWTTMSMEAPPSAPVWIPSPALALDSAGRPRILATSFQNNFAPNDTEGGCAVAVILHPSYMERDQATGTGPFTTTVIGPYRHGRLHGLATSGTRSHLAWLDVCDRLIIHSETPVVAAVEPVRRLFSPLRLAPNPVRSGGVLAIRLSTERESPITLRIEDVAGRRVATREHTGSRGETSIAWTLPTLRAGWYRVTARQGGTPLGSGSFLIID